MTVQSPIPDFAAARKAMVESQLRPQGVTDAGVIDAMGKVEREKFLRRRHSAARLWRSGGGVEDGRFLPAPAVLGQLLTQMAARAWPSRIGGRRRNWLFRRGTVGDGARVTAIESYGRLPQSPRPGCHRHAGRLEAGWPNEAPFDQILIDGAVGFIPEAIIAQLADGGRLGTALIDRGVTRLIIGRKAGDAFGYLSIGDAGMPALPGFSRPPAFTF